MKKTIRMFLLWCLKLFSETKSKPQVRTYDFLNGLFDNPDVEPTNEKKMTFAERIGRARAVRGLIQQPGWKVIEDIVSYTHKALIARMASEKDQLEWKKAQGVMVGIAKLRQATIRVLVDGERAKMDMMEEEIEKGRRPYAKPEVPSAPPT